MDEIVSFIFGSATSPIEMAGYFMIFMLLLDAIFSVVINLVNGVRG